MKKIAVFIFFIFFLQNLLARDRKIDSLRKAFSKAQKLDLARMQILGALTDYYIFSRPDSAIIFGQEAYEIAVSKNAKKDENDLLNRIAFSYLNLGDYTKSLNLFFKLKQVYAENNDQIDVVKILNNIAVAFDDKGDYSKAISYAKLGLNVLNSYESVNLLKDYRERQIKTMLYLNIGNQFTHLKQLDSAERYLNFSYFFLKKYHIRDDVLVSIFYEFGEIEKKKGNEKQALRYYRQAIPLSIANQDLDNLSLTYLGIADLYHRYKQLDSAEYYGQKSLEVANLNNLLQDKLNASQTLSGYFEEDHNIEQAYRYLKLTIAIKDSLFSQDKIKQLLALDFDERQRARDIEEAKEKERTMVKFYFSMLGTVIFILFAFIFWRESRQRAKANKQLQKQQAELDLINQNLETMISERTSDLVDKNKKLFEYSYYLSHQIRGPVSTIKGLVNIEKEGLIEQDEFVKMVNTCVADIDNKIIEINNILHERIEPLR